MTATALLARPSRFPEATVEDPYVIDLYCRMSFGDDGTVFKCEDQEVQGRQSIETWARSLGLTLGREVVIGEVIYDHALSAWKPKVVRPGFVTIMDRLEASVSQGVWIREVDRFTRKMHEAVRIADVAKSGAFVLALRSDYDLTTRKGRKRFLEDAMDAEDESSRISERSQDGNRMKALRGKPLNSQRGFGRDGYLPRPKRADGSYDTDAVRVRVPEEQLALERSMIRDAATRIIAGEPLARIASEWNDAGSLTLKGGRWDTGNLRHMLEAPAVAGLVEHKGQIVAEPGDGPLDRETWDRLMRTFQSRRRGRPATVYLLSGVLFCGECGARLYGRPRKDRREYWCQIRPREETGCARVNIEREFADLTVKAMVMKRLGDPRHADRLARVSARVQAEATRLRAERERINAEMDSLAEKAGTSPRWTVERVDAAMEKYEPQLAKVEADLKALESKPEAGMNSAIVDAESDWEGGSDEHRRLLIRRAFPEGLEVTRAATSRPETLKASRIRKRIRGV